MYRRRNGEKDPIAPVSSKKSSAIPEAFAFEGQLLN